jgi:hypothetical protein
MRPVSIILLAPLLLIGCVGDDTPSERGERSEASAALASSDGTPAPGADLGLALDPVEEQVDSAPGVEQSDYDGEGNGPEPDPWRAIDPEQDGDPAPSPGPDFWGGQKHSSVH